MIGKGSQVFRSVGARYLEAFVDMKDFLIENHNRGLSYYTIFTIHRLLLDLSVDLFAYSGTWSF